MVLRKQVQSLTVHQVFWVSIREEGEDVWVCMGFIYTGISLHYYSSDLPQKLTNLKHQLVNSLYHVLYHGM